MFRWSCFQYIYIGSCMVREVYVEQYVNRPIPLSHAALLANDNYNKVCSYVRCASGHTVLLTYRLHVQFILSQRV